MKRPLGVTIIAVLLNLLRHVFEFVRPHPGVLGIVGIIIPLAILIYLFADPNVRTAFFSRG